MLGADIATVSWPDCGEVDVMENIGKEPSINHGSMHVPAAGTSTDSQLTGQYTLPGGAKLGDGFHTYAVEWSASAVSFYVDDNLYEIQTPATATNRSWEVQPTLFHHFECGGGGKLPRLSGLDHDVPTGLKVDWARVYEPAAGG